MMQEPVDDAMEERMKYKIKKGDSAPSFAPKEQNNTDNDGHLLDGSDSHELFNEMMRILNEEMDPAIEDHSKAKSERILMEQLIKSKLAEVASKLDVKSESAKERMARNDEKYKEHLKQYAATVAEEAKCKGRVDKLFLKVEVLRSGLSMAKKLAPNL